VFNLNYTFRGVKVGTIEYFLPRKAVHFGNNGSYGSKSRDGFAFSPGGIELNVFGSIIFNKYQYKEIRHKLKKIHR
jgi:hypothetical protein